MVIPPLNWCFSPSPPGQLLTPKEESWRRWRLPGGSWWQRSVPQSLDEKIQIKFKDLKKTKTLMSQAWNAWGKLLIAYKATKAQSKGKRTKKHTKRIKQKTYCGNYLPIQFCWSPLNPQSVTPQKVDSENQSCTCTCAPGKQPGICPCHPCIAPGKATICAFRSWERRQAD